MVTTEATYLRSLDVLIDHFMDDPGMNPNLPEGRRVLDKRQHHVIFSNVKEVRETSAKWVPGKKREGGRKGGREGGKEGVYSNIIILYISIS